MKKIIFLVALLLPVLCLATDRYTVAQTAVNIKGQTLVTSCINTKGYYFEIGEPTANEHLVVYGFGGVMELKTIVKDLLMTGWKVKYGKYVNTSQKIHWMGHKAWTNWLRELAFQNNLAIIIDWHTRMLYINCL